MEARLRELLEEGVRQEIAWGHYVIGDEITELSWKLGELTDVEREIILKGCLINYYRG